MTDIAHSPSPGLYLPQMSHYHLASGSPSPRALPRPQGPARNSLACPPVTRGRGQWLEVTSDQPASALPLWRTLCGPAHRPLHINLRLILKTHLRTIPQGTKPLLCAQEAFNPTSIPLLCTFWPTR